jgi:hypothetical protein
MEGHHCSAFHIAELEPAGRSVHVNIEKLRYRGSVFGEIGICKAFLPLLVVINNVVGLW